jgi:hypothetical protein
MATLAERLALPDMAALSAAEAAAALNTRDAANGTVFQNVAPDDIFNILLDVGAWGRVELWSRPAPGGTVSVPGPTDALVARCINVVRAVDRNQPLHTTRDAIRTQWASIFGGLVTDGLITAGTRNLINALASRTATWAEANGYPNGVTSRDVGLARGDKP